MIPRPPISTLFPYTTLFRSVLMRLVTVLFTAALTGVISIASAAELSPTQVQEAHRIYISKCAKCHRSEEHTSELQSHSDLVCRLLLEKKKTKNNKNQTILNN